MINIFSSRVHEGRNRPHGLVDGRKNVALKSQKKFTPRPNPPDLGFLKSKLSNPRHAQMAYAWLRMCHESKIQESLDWLDGKSQGPASDPHNMYFNLHLMSRV